MSITFIINFKNVLQPVIPTCFLALWYVTGNIHEFTFVLTGWTYLWRFLRSKCISTMRTFPFCHNITSFSITNLHKFCFWRPTFRASFRRLVAFMDISTNNTSPLCHLFHLTLFFSLVHHNNMVLISAPHQTR